ncbi:hypothetical protein PROFUN_05767 [Planoprotostelium fungivorum]|uniref:AAA+ ATPase domain-containing protein n=1 Tax=Planoprotostelium fungivorum TaxID=1890364 RepID=A0A2P6NPW0_9EUKA|nr:hypothetical protein PROFUN_05767 [Planoprotostelium fungivorum]
MHPSFEDELYTTKRHRKTLSQAITKTCTRILLSLDFNLKISTLCESRTKIASREHKEIMWRLQTHSASKLLPVKRTNAILSLNNRVTYNELRLGHFTSTAALPQQYSHINSGMLRINTSLGRRWYSEGKSEANNEQDNKQKEGEGKGKKEEQKKTGGAEESKSGPKMWSFSEARERREKARGRIPFSGGNQSGKWGTWVYLVAGSLGTFIFVSYLMGSNFSPEIDWYTFKNTVLQTGQVEKLTVDTQMNMVRVFIKNGSPRGDFMFTIGDTRLFEKQLEQAQNDLGIDVVDHIPVQYHGRGFGSQLIGASLGALIPLALVFGVFYLVMRRSRAGGRGADMFGFGKSKAKRITKESGLTTKFSEVAGMDESKLEVMEFVDFLKNAPKYKKLGAKIPKGALLVGPPGTGKTLLARATAGEASVPFFSVAGSDFIEMFGGMGSARVRDLFKEARENAPCIVFIDEIDAMGRERSKMGTNDERENTLNQLLVEMDGFDSTSGVVILAGTNRADILDKALLRPGRFDRQILVDLPDIKGRNDIFQIHLKKLKLEETNLSTYSEKLSTLTPGFSGADIANICNEGALYAARRSHPAVTMNDLESAIERVIGGAERQNRIMSPEEKRQVTVAYHEAGHAVTGWYLQHVDPLLKVSIVPRGVAALGYAQYQPKDQNLYSKEELFDRICMTLGGRIAEIIKFGKITTGASDDLDKVTKMAYSQVALYGMNESIGTVSYDGNTGSQYVPEKSYSEATGKLIDEEARKLVLTAFNHTQDLLSNQKENLEKVAQLLLQREVISRDDLTQLLGPRPWADAPTTYDQLTYKQPPVSPTPETTPGEGGIAQPISKMEGSVEYNRTKRREVIKAKKQARDESKHCGMFLPLKNRYCKLPPEGDQLYCTQHKLFRFHCGALMRPSTIFEEDKERHALKCPLLRDQLKQTSQPYFRKGANAGSDLEEETGDREEEKEEENQRDEVEGREEKEKADKRETVEEGEKGFLAPGQRLKREQKPSPFLQLTDHQLQELIDKRGQIETGFDKYVKGHIVDDFRESSACQELPYYQGKKKNLKHAIQESSITQHLRDRQLMEEKEKTVFLEFDNGSHVQAEKTSKNRSEEMKRVSMDIADLDMSQMPDLKDQSVVIVSKHLCGAAADLTVRCAFKENMNIRAVMIANCCHHRCMWSSYVNKRYIMEDIGVPKEQFKLLCAVSSWASAIPFSDLDAAEEEFKAKAPSDTVYGELSPKRKSELGLKSKRILDMGRVLHLREKGYKASLCYYVPKEVTPENCLMIVQRGSLERE